MTKRIYALLLALILCFSLCACDASSSITDSMSFAGGAVNDLAIGDSLSTDKGFFTNYDDKSESISPENPDNAPTEATPNETEQPTVETTNQKIIYIGRITLQTINFDDSIEAINKLVTSYDGFIESSDIDGNVIYNDDGTAKIYDRFASYVIRVPSQHFETVMTECGHIGNVTNSNSEATNVTSQFTDNESRLKALKLQEERLFNLMETANVTEMLEINAQLADVQHEIDYTERTLRDLSSYVAYSTIELQVDEVDGYEEAVSVQQTFGQRLASGFKSGWTGFVAAIQGLIIGIAELSPIMILALIGIIIFITYRKKNGGKTNKPNEKIINAGERLKKLVGEDDEDDSDESDD